MDDNLPEVLTKDQLAELIQVPVRTIESWRSYPPAELIAASTTSPGLLGRRVGKHVRYSKRAWLDFIERGDDQPGGRS